MTTLSMVASHKGGTGKSTAITNLAGLLAALGRRVALIDTDSVNAASGWAAIRKGNPALKPIDYEICPPGLELQGLLTELKVARTYDDLLVDFQGSDTAENRYMLHMADRLIFPFKAGRFDRDTIPWMKTLVGLLAKANPKQKSFILLNELSTLSKKSLISTTEEFKSHGFTASGIFHKRQSFEDSAGLGMSVFEMQDDKAREELLTFADKIYPEYNVRQRKRSKAVEMHATM